MLRNLPDLYFRIRDNGAAVFRLDPETRHGRIDLEQVAVVNVRTGEIRPQGDRKLSAAETAEIAAWLKARSEVLARREGDGIAGTIEALNLTAHWAQTRATDDELDAVTDALLLAMHDLRSVLVRKAADRINTGDESNEG